jgi:hypothetical protein
LPAGTVAKPVPQTMDEANKVAIRIQGLDKKIAKAEVRRKRLSTQIKAAQAVKAELEKEREEEQELLRAFADPRRNQLVADADTKNFKFPCGAVGQWGYPSNPALVVGATIEKILRALLRLPNGLKYVDVKLKKNVIKADLAELHSASPTLRKALHTDGKERFWVKT